jgi:Fe-S-cluster containining protein
MSSVASDRLVDFLCSRCGNCCRVPGVVRLRDGEAETLAAHLGMTVHAFTDRYTRLTGDRSGLSLGERDDGACVFLTDEGLCRINDVKPRQCVEFPRAWRFEGVERICRAMKGEG